MTDVRVVHDALSRLAGASGHADLIARCRQGLDLLEGLGRELPVELVELEERLPPPGSAAAAQWLEALHRTIGTVVAPRRGLVVKTHILPHGQREHCPFDDHHTLRDVERVLVARHHDAIQKYLSRQTAEPLRSEPTTLRFFPGRPRRGAVPEPIDPDTRVADLPHIETDGVYWWPRTTTPVAPPGPYGYDWGARPRPALYFLDECRENDLVTPVMVDFGTIGRLGGAYRTGLAVQILDFGLGTKAAISDRLSVRHTGGHPAKPPTDSPDLPEFETISVAPPSRRIDITAIGDLARERQAWWTHLALPADSPPPDDAANHWPGWATEVKLRRLFDAHREQQAAAVATLADPYSEYGLGMLRLANPTLDFRPLGNPEAGRVIAAGFAAARVAAPPPPVAGRPVMSWVFGRPQPQPLVAVLPDTLPPPPDKPRDRIEELRERKPPEDTPLNRVLNRMAFDGLSNTRVDPPHPVGRRGDVGPRGRGWNWRPDRDRPWAGRKRGR